MDPSCGRSAERILTLRNRHRVLADLAVARDLERHDITDEPAIQADLQLAAILHRPAIEREHDVADTNPRALRHAPRRDIGDDDAVRLRQTKPGGERRRERLRADADVAATHAPVLPDSVRRRVRAMLLGAAKPSPSLAPRCDTFNVLMPTMRPRRSTSGPPLLPGLIEASVWTYTIGDSGASCRATELTIPSDTVFSSPSGLPNGKHQLTRAQLVGIAEGSAGNAPPAP